MDPQGKIALVTGGAHRVGGAISLALAEAGANLVIHYHSSHQAAEVTAVEASRHGVEVLTHPANLRDREQRESLFDALETRFGGLDILVNSAAIMEPINLLDVTEEDWHSTIDLNLMAAFFCLQRAARSMLARGGGVVINISDIAGLQPWLRFPVHSISKAGVEMLTKTAALALAPHVRVNAVAPGPVLKPTGMVPERWKEIGAQLPLGKAGNPGDVAEAVLFLVRQEFITGETLVVDGGQQLT
ncbi:MAG TPA: SDR family oxidoreductase [Chloroflexi bacterium]|nr:SDR family oxidoreductase [Chloroflexota bacterium]